MQQVNTAGQRDGCVISVAATAEGHWQVAKEGVHKVHAGTPCPSPPTHFMAACFRLVASAASSRVMGARLVLLQWRL